MDLLHHVIFHPIPISILRSSSGNLCGKTRTNDDPHNKRATYLQYLESLAYIQREFLNKLKNMTHLMNNPPCEWEEEAKMY